MKETNRIKKVDLNNYETDENGDYIVPVGMKVYVSETVDDMIKNVEDKISEIELIEPSNEELIEFAKEMHPYYHELEKKDRLLNELNELKKLQ